MFLSKGAGLFRYSAALVEWSWGELKELEKIWMQAYKVAWHLPEQTATSIFAFPKEQGGREYPTPLGIMAQELVRHVESCRRHDDLTNDIIKLELKDAKEKWLCNSFKDLTEEMQLRQWDEIRDNTWSRLAKCMQLLDMQLEIPEEGEAAEASEISWAKLTRPIRKFRWRAEAVGGRQVCFDQQIWRMSKCQWATIFRCEKSFWEGARLLTDSGHKGVKALEQRDRQDSTTQRDKACEGKVPLFIRHQASSRAREAEEGIAASTRAHSDQGPTEESARGIPTVSRSSRLERHRRRRQNKRVQSSWRVVCHRRRTNAGSASAMAGEAGDPGSTV